MRLVIQRVCNASVVCRPGPESPGQTKTIEKGLCVLVGIGDEDGVEDSEFLVKKLLGLKVWSPDDDSPKWQQSVTDIAGEVLLVSQFTLHAAYKGTKPSFHRAMTPEKSKPFYYDFVSKVQEAYSADKVQTCVFGSNMAVSLVNDGPVTLILDSKNRKGG